TSRVVRESGRVVTDTRTYDAAGRTLTTARQVTGEPALVASYTYDSNGNRTATQRGSAPAVRLTFDTFDRPLRRSRGVPGKGYREVTFGYDAAGRLATVTRGAGAEGSTTTSRFDGYGRLVAMSTPDGVTLRISHDANGNVVRQERGAKGAPELAI